MFLGLCQLSIMELFAKEVFFTKMFIKDFRKSPKYVFSHRCSTEHMFRKISKNICERTHGWVYFQ